MDGQGRAESGVELIQLVMKTAAFRPPFFMDAAAEAASTNHEPCRSASLAGSASAGSCS
jgi:hypothetical protein